MDAVQDSCDIPVGPVQLANSRANIVFGSLLRENEREVGTRRELEREQKLETYRAEKTTLTSLQLHSPWRPEWRRRIRDRQRLTLLNAEVRVKRNKERVVENSKRRRSVCRPTIKMVTATNRRILVATKRTQQWLTFFFRMHTPFALTPFANTIIIQLHISPCSVDSQPGSRQSCAHTSRPGVSPLLHDYRFPGLK